MSDYQPHWDLSTIPESAWNSENGRRNFRKRWVNPEWSRKRAALKVQADLRKAKREYKRIFDAVR